MIVIAVHCNLDFLCNFHFWIQEKEEEEQKEEQEKDQEEQEAHKEEHEDDSSIGSNPFEEDEILFLV